MELQILDSTLILNFSHICFMCSDVSSMSLMPVTEERDMNPPESRSIYVNND